MTQRIALWFGILILLTASTAPAQEDQLSLGELARRERERKRNTTTPAHVIELEDPFVNCNANWNCLINSVDQRQPARMFFQETVDMGEVYGTTLRSGVRLEIRDFTSSTVVLTSRPENTRMSFQGAMRKDLHEEGMTEEKINDLERRAERAMQSGDGILVTCTFQFARVRRFLTLAKDHPELDYRWDLADNCTGLKPAANPTSGPRGIGASRPR